jgi:hypothetical protein
MTDISKGGYIDTGEPPVPRLWLLELLLRAVNHKNGRLPRAGGWSTGMFRFVLMTVLASAVSGCVTSDPGAVYSQSSKTRSVQSRQAAKTTANTVQSAHITPPAIILGAAY